ncbi:MAG: hypothetical protein QXK37_03100 [Candidatus Woesearchaeota archaeon]
MKLRWISIWITAVLYCIGFAFGICNETDSGKEIYLKGTTKNESATFSDRCTTDALVEYFCIEGTIQSEVVSCKCYEGACLEKCDNSCTQPQCSGATCPKLTCLESYCYPSICGNKECEKGETKAVCPSDCNCTVDHDCEDSLLCTMDYCEYGVCKHDQVHHCREPSEQKPIIVCTADWQCSEWSECTIEGKQTRTCTDINNCGDIPPPMIRLCQYQPRCDDGIINGDETGIDCGGVCLPCPILITPPKIILVGPPVIAEPLTKVEVTIQVSNIGGEDADDVKIIVLPPPEWQTPSYKSLYLYSGEDKNITFVLESPDEWSENALKVKAFMQNVLVAEYDIPLEASIPFFKAAISKIDENFLYLMVNTNQTLDNLEIEYSINKGSKTLYTDRTKVFDIDSGSHVLAKRLPPSLAANTTVYAALYQNGNKIAEYGQKPSNNQYYIFFAVFLASVLFGVIYFIYVKYFKSLR